MSLIGCRCVDKFFVWVWPDGTQKTERTARRIQVDKTKTSHIVQVSCGWLTGGHTTSDWSGGALHRLQVRPGVRGGRHEEELPLDLGRGVQDLGGGEPRVAGPGEVQRGLPLGPRQARVRPQARLHQIPEKPHQECQLPRLHPGHFRSSIIPQIQTRHGAAGDWCGGAGAGLHPAPLQPRLHDGARVLGTPRHAPSQGRGTSAGSAGQHLLIIIGIQPGLLFIIFIFFRVQSGFFLIIGIQPGLLLPIFLRVQPGLLHVIPARGKLSVWSDRNSSLRQHSAQSNLERSRETCRYCRYYLEPEILPITALARLARSRCSLPSWATPWSCWSPRPTARSSTSRSRCSPPPASRSAR